MASVGIIAEYNPLHNGHIYQIQEIKKRYPNDTIIIAMSGNFTQRGEPAIINKWSRAQLAIEAGADLVVEIPYHFATQSADYFSYAGITLLEQLKVEKLIFGSESNNLDSITEIAKAELKDDNFDKLVKIYSKFGYNYPTALSLALKDLTGKIIDTPNDILGITYIKTILKYKYKIKPESIKRINNYNNKELTGKLSSATAIRENIDNLDKIKETIPNTTLKQLTKETLHKKEDYFKFLKYKIITEQHLEQYHLVEKDLAVKLKKEILCVSSYEELIQKVKSKHQTYSKISRALLQILCNYKKEDAQKNQQLAYIRLLAFNTKGKEYLNRYKKEITLPIISKISKNKNKMLELELNTTKIYTLPYNNSEQEYKKEYQCNLYRKEN
ncbi:MAG: nucleotidyltransferase [bacterium]|nr:nucleotidyltransferase [Mycoplasmatota bacterium]MDD6756598.1 nucleotidyltransferase [bacterium]MDY2907968.1 nucleotidyltransferase [Candidatus Faecimonas sp.]